MVSRTLFAAVLDASVLYPLPLRDTLLRVGATELYEPRWSQGILDEVARNLIADGRGTQAQTRRLIDAMSSAFEDAAVPQDAVDRLSSAMTNHEKDRHVLAAAVVGGAQAVVTLDLTGFPEDACEPFGIVPLHPDDFLIDLYDLAAEELARAVEQQALALRRPPMTLDDLVERLAATVPRFAAALRRHS